MAADLGESTVLFNGMTSVELKILDQIILLTHERNYSWGFDIFDPVLG